MASLRPSLSVRYFSHAAPVRMPLLPQSYFVPRNANGNLPVYSDIRNNGTRYLVLIRGVDGKAQALAQELRTSFCKSSSGKLPKVGIEHGKNIVITGKVEKNEVIEWLKIRGF